MPKNPPSNTPIQTGYYDINTHAGHHTIQSPSNSSVPPAKNNKSKIELLSVANKTLKRSDGITIGSSK